MRLYLTLLLIFVSSMSFAQMQNVEILYRESGITQYNYSRSVSIINGHVEHHEVSGRAAIIEPTARVYNKQGVIYENIYNQGFHSFSIQNLSNFPESYDILLKPCADDSYCFWEKTGVRVAPYGWYVDNAVSYLTCSFTKEGNYSLVAITKAAQNTATDWATIYIK